MKVYHNTQQYHQYKNGTSRNYRYVWDISTSPKLNSCSSSSGLICPKRIYNFCLLHACFVLYCYDLDTLSYTFDHIWTNLLTQCTPVQVPVFCCFSISGFPHIKSPPKIREKSDKKS